MIQSNAGHSVYEGWTVTGWPVVTLRRGEVVFEDGRVVGLPGSGQLVRREPTQPLPHGGGGGSATTRRGGR